MATNRSEITSDEIINIKCSLCSKENRTKEADKYCVQCRDYYCLTCTDMHSKFPALMDHELMDKVNLGSLDLDRSLPSFPTQRCSLHTGKIVDMFCKDHNDVACASCMFLSHRACKKIHCIPEEIDTIYNRTELTNAKQKTHKLKTTMEEIKNALENEVAELKEVLNNEVKSIKEFRLELQTLLENMEQETIKELKSEFERLESMLVRKISEMKNLIDGMNEISLQMRKSEGNKAQEFISVNLSEKAMKKVEDMVNEQKGKKQKTCSFIADQKLKEFLEKTSALGIVSSHKQGTCNQKDKVFKVKCQREINVKLANDSHDCYVMGSCITEDGFLLLVDYNNKKLKRLDMSNDTIKDYLDLQRGPYAVCSITKTEAAVSMDSSTVQFVSLGNKLTASRMLQLNHLCEGVAYINEGKLFVSDYRDTVFIHDMNGRELQRIPTVFSGKKIFQATRNVRICAGGDKVVVADQSKGVVILDIKGNHLFTLTDPTLSGCHDVCTDGRNMFVCGFSSNNIVQIGPDYKIIGEIAKITGPYSLCFDQRLTRLLVTSGNTVTVLELE